MKIPAALSLVLGCTLFSAGLSAAVPLPTSASPDHPPIPTYNPAPKFPADLRKHALVAEVIVAVAVIVLNYRARWLYGWLVGLSVWCLIGYPFFTIIGIFALVALVAGRKQFLEKEDRATV
jgi:hypothetical protein